MARSVSQAEIARTLGISQSAVSFALNNSGRITAETRQRVRQLCEKLHYRPNAQAQSLRRAATKLVGVACGSPTDSFEAHLIDSLEEQLHQRGYQMMLHTGTLGDASQAWDRALTFVDHRACGIIFRSISPDLHEKIAEVFPGMFPMVTIGATRAGSPGVGCDYDKAGRCVARHLLALGRKRWATNITAGQWSEDVRPKTAAFCKAALQAGLAAPVQAALEGHYYETHLDEYGWVLAKAVMEKHPDVDALFLGCDDVAVGAVAWLRQAGYRVPEDVAVVGFNDSPLARTAAVPLTSIRQPVREYARLAVEMLIEQIDQGDDFVPRAQLVECELVVRQSTDPNYRREPPQGPAPTLWFLNADPSAAQAARGEKN